MGIERLQDRLRSEGDPGKKEWWERYLKGAISFHGVPMGRIRTLVAEWRAEQGLATGDLQTTAFDLLALPIAEEKLAGILLLEEHALPEGGVDDALLDGLERLLDEGTIADWNTVDWLCVRVLGPHIAASGVAAADRVSGWVTAPSLWRRRCSLVAYVPLAAADPPVLADMTKRLIGTATTLAPDPERFAQTAIGWTLRELSDVAPDEVHSFLLDHREVLSREAIRMAAARLSDEQRKELGVTGKRTRR
ncbi:MAG: DNA alkylation repair protein [Acidimicrobiia bacterium]|nr:DNA alkylation repair protein [Acidimicrobiia bacterium]